MRRALLVCLTLSPLAACASSERRLDDAWDRFQTERTAVATHAERVCAVASDDARASGDDRRLVLLTTPPESPMSRVLLASSLASVAWLDGDLTALDRALHALRRCEDDLSAVERGLATPAPSR